MRAGSVVALVIVLSVIILGCVPESDHTGMPEPPSSEEPETPISEPQPQEQIPESFGCGSNRDCVLWKRGCCCIESPLKLVNITFLAGWTSLNCSGISCPGISCVIESYTCADNKCTLLDDLVIGRNFPEYFNSTWSIHLEIEKYDSGRMEFDDKLEVLGPYPWVWSFEQFLESNGRYFLGDFTLRLIDTNGTIVLQYPFHLNEQNMILFWDGTDATGGSHLFDYSHTWMTMPYQENLDRVVILRGNQVVKEYDKSDFLIEPFDD